MGLINGVHGMALLRLIYLIALESHCRLCPQPYSLLSYVLMCHDVS